MIGKSFSAIIVSFQTRDLLRRCLCALSVQRGVDVELWVVDNASTDGSAEMVAVEFPGVHLIRNGENVGFARANNQAMGLASGAWLALVNPDTELPPDAFASVVGVFGSHPHAGAVGLALENPDGSPQPSCHRFPGLINLAIESLGLQRIAPRIGVGTPSQAPPPRGGEGEVDWVAGACWILSRRAYQAVGGLNADLFMYGEEMDWSWRARRSGFSTVFSNRSVVLHHGGASGSGLRGELFVRNLEARLYFLRRYRGAWRAAIAREIMVAGACLRWTYWRIRAALPGSGGRAHYRTSEQLERFQAILDWRWSSRS